MEPTLVAPVILEQRKERPGHVMLDIETLGIDEKAPVLSVACVAFTLENGISKTIKNFHRKVDIEFYDSHKDKFEISYSTLKFWLKNPLAMLKAFSGTERLDDVLKEMSKWVSELGNPDVKVWCQSPDFDCVILKNAYKSMNLPVPWKFWNQRCTRTYYDLMPGYKPGKADHDALADCILQVSQVCKVYEHLTQQKKI
jgi:hypothetical protein